MFADDSLAQRKKEALEKRAFDDYLSFFGSHERFREFVMLRLFLKDEEYWPLLREVWIMNETSMPHLDLWCRLFRSKRSQRQLLMQPEEHAALAQMPDEVTIWRGAGQEAGIRGLSWTLNEERARFFADYSCGPRRGHLTPGWQGTKPMVAKAICRKNDILGYFTDREEAEIVVDPKRLRQVEARPL